MKKVVLCIIDGVGINPSSKGNAVLGANTKNLDEMLEKYPNAKLEASGTLVGLPDSQMGNSEVGHLNIGAGRVVDQLYQMINKDLEEGGLEKNDSFMKLINHVKLNNSKLHLSGLLSSGGVHSDIKHLIKIVEVCKKFGVDVCYHFITDGRDVSIGTAMKFIKEIQNLSYGEIVSIGGRLYAMDRNSNYDRVHKFYDCLVGKAEISDLTIDDYVLNNDQTDEFFEPTLFSNNYIKENDAFLFFNYRADRARQLMEILTVEHDYFDVIEFKNVLFMGLTEYKSTFTFDVLYKNIKVINPIGKVLADNNISQYRLAETEKYAHVTYYFDGGVEEDYALCDKKLIPSKNSISYASTPQMSAYEISDDLEEKITNKSYDFILVNFANGDMVGHTGDLDASIKAMEVLDECIFKLNQLCLDNNYLLVVTADHGNCEVMLDDDDNVVTSHTTNKVMLMINDLNIEIVDGKLGDIAPSILNLMGLKIPQEMSGNIIINEKK